MVGGPNAGRESLRKKRASKQHFSVATASVPGARVLLETCLDFPSVIECDLRVVN